MQRGRLGHTRLVHVGAHRARRLFELHARGDDAAVELGAGLGDDLLHVGLAERDRLLQRVGVGGACLLERGGGLLEPFRLGGAGLLDLATGGRGGLRELGPGGLDEVVERPLVLGPGRLRRDRGRLEELGLLLHPPGELGEPGVAGFVGGLGPGLEVGEAALARAVGGLRARLDVGDAGGERLVERVELLRECLERRHA